MTGGHPCDVRVGIFTGFLVDVALSAAYASSDILVFPSTTDTFGPVVLEAMASGVPVIVSDRGGACELVQHGRTGLVAKGEKRPGAVGRMPTRISGTVKAVPGSAPCQAQPPS